MPSDRRARKVAGARSSTDGGGRLLSSSSSAAGPTGRLRLSCLRCQRRKVRCDGAVPACTNCVKAGAECTDGESCRMRNLPRAYIGTLKSRIAWLESIVQSRCPDVDLALDGPQVIEGPEWKDDDESLNGVDQPAVSPVARFTQSQNLPSPPNLDQSSLPGSGRSAGPHNNDGPGGPDPSVPPQAALPEKTGLSHEVGLVSLGASHDPRYIGPSSGFVLSRLMLVAAKRTGQTLSDMADVTPAAQPNLGGLVEENEGPIPLGEPHERLSQVYFDVIHLQYPFLHRPTFMESLAAVRRDQDEDPTRSFQVYMVLAISATLASRLHKIPLRGERYYSSAMHFFDRVQLEGSIQGLQCLLLLLLFAMHSPSVRLNSWYLNYHCIAAVLDLGLQRDITTKSGISKLEQEMRNRIFWVVFTLDRTIATIMGRPIGLRDEACDLRLPSDISDEDLCDPKASERAAPSSSPSHMSYSIHLSKLARINSEIKYVANSINTHPIYAYPTTIDIGQWQGDVLQRLDQWLAETPSQQQQQQGRLSGSTSNSSSNGRSQIDMILTLRYHAVRMLLTRPSPSIPRPGPGVLRACFASAVESARLYHELYRRDLLVHSWTALHSVVLSVITMFYCLCSVPDLARATAAAAGSSSGGGGGDDFAAAVRSGLSVLGALGEHWSGAKRSRDILDELSDPIFRWLRKLGETGGGAGGAEAEGAAYAAGQQDAEQVSAAAAGGLAIPGQPGLATNPSAGAMDGAHPTGPAPVPDLFAGFPDVAGGDSWEASLATFGGLLDGRPLADQYGVTEFPDVDNMMFDLFDDFVPPG